VSAVAGKIAHTIRDGFCPTILATGHVCIATAAKAVATSRTYLSSEGRDIVFTPAFRDEHHNRALLSFTIAPVEPAEAAQRQEGVGDRELKVSASSRHAAVAAALSARLSEHGSVLLSAVGSEAIFNAVMACAHAACYLESTQKQLQVSPASVRVTNGNDVVMAFKLVVCLV
jgi:stage V sporulation protein SpoVS